MDLKPFDVVIFRKKNLMQSFYSIITLDLDNHVGIVIEVNGKNYLNHFVILNFYHLLCNIFFNTSYKCGRYILTPIEKLINDELYVYRPNTIYKSTKDVRDILIKAENKLNYLSNFKLIVGFLISKNIFHVNIMNNNFNNHTCISYLLWFLNECELYDFNSINNDFYQKRIELFKGLKNKYRLTKGYNIGKKNLSKFNPYSLSYLFAFIFNILLFPRLSITNIYGEHIPWYTMIFNLCIITPICTIHSYHTHLMWNWNSKGKRYIGVVITYVFLSIILLEYNLNIDKNFITYIAYLMFSPRIMMTRFASWLCNDIKGIINKNNERPYDVALYESLWEGLIPTLFILFSPKWIPYNIKNLIISFNYSISRFIIEFYKHSHLNDSLITLGQVDSILNIIFMYWYIQFSYNNFYQYIFDYCLLFIFYIDTCFRFSLNKFNYNMNFANILKLQWKTTHNKGFYNGYMISHNPYKKIVFPLPMLVVSNYFLIKYNQSIYFFNLFAGLNIFERFVNGYVTDYLTIQFFSLKTFNLNFADIMINVYLVIILSRILNLFR